MYVLEDPDYDLIRYRYEWKVNGKKVRTITASRAARRAGGEGLA